MYIGWTFWGRIMQAVVPSSCVVCIITSEHFYEHRKLKESMYLLLKNGGCQLVHDMPDEGTGIASIAMYTNLEQI